MSIHTQLTISQADRRPMYLQIMEQIRHRVAIGEWQPGEEIPSIRVLAASTRVSVITVKRAYLELERAGVITTRQGRGTFVANDVDLSRQLREQELDEHLGKAVAVALELGLTKSELEARLGDVVGRKDREDPGKDL
ncbi:MAG TPA: GntR family transcriptional regulator [Thermoanaerobaculia bacterium]